MHSIFYDTRIVRVRSTDQSEIAGGKIPFDPNVFPFIEEKRECIFFLYQIQIHSPFSTALL